jgi:tetratricopeptide (TPR) repeat protein
MIIRSVSLAFLVCLLLSTAAHAQEAEWLLARGQLALGKGEPGTAFGLFQQGEKQFSDDKRFVYLAAIAAERRGQLDDALSRLTALASSDAQRQFPALDLDQGRVLFKLGRLDEAERHLRRHTVANPQDAAGFIWLGETQLARGQNEEAFQFFNRAAQPQPRLRSIFHYTRGAILFGSNPSESAQEMQRAIEADRTGPVAPLAQRFITMGEEKDDLARSYHIDTALGLQHDTNMLLNSDEDSSRYSGQRLVVGGVAYARPKIGERFFLGMGARIAQIVPLSVESEGRELPDDRFGAGSYTALLDGALLFPGGAKAWEPGLEYAFQFGTLAGSGHSLTHSLYPRVTLYQGAKSASKFYGIFQLIDLRDVPDVAPLDSFESGMLFGGGAAHYRVFKNRLDALGFFGEYVVRTVDQDDAGTPYHGPRAGLNGRKRLVADLYADFGVFTSYRLMDNADNNGLYISADAGLGYLFFGHLEVALNTGYIRNMSAAASSYDRVLAGVFLRGFF